MLWMALFIFVVMIVLLLLGFPMKVPLSAAALGVDRKSVV